MPHQLNYIKPIELQDLIMSRKWLQDFGSYNRMPTPFAKIDDFTFADIAKRGLPEYIEYRVMEAMEKDIRVYVPVYIYWYDDGGLMVMFDNNSGLMQFYLIGCVHEFDETIEKGAHNLKCKLCGYQDIIYDEDITGIK